MGWDYKFHDWNESNDVGDIQLKVSILNNFFIFHLQIDKTNSNIDNACSRVWICVQNDVSFFRLLSIYIIHERERVRNPLEFYS